MPHLPVESHKPDINSVYMFASLLRRFEGPQWGDDRRLPAGQRWPPGGQCERQTSWHREVDPDR